MELKHEEIQTNERIPIKLFNFQANDIARIIPNHWHKSAEILYCRKGSLNVWINNKNYLLREGDFLFINSNIVHSTQSVCGKINLHTIAAQKYITPQAA